MADFVTPELKEIPEIPKYVVDTMKGTKSFIAKVQFQEQLGAHLSLALN